MDAAPADPTRVSGSALAVSQPRCWTRRPLRATTRLSYTPWTRSGTMGFLGPRWPGAGSRQQLPCLDPDGWLVRMLQANRNENPAAELKARAVEPIPIATGELPLPRAELYPLTRSLLMGGTYSPIPAAPGATIATGVSMIARSGQTGSPGPTLARRRPARKCHSGQSDSRRRRASATAGPPLPVLSARNAR